MNTIIIEHADKSTTALFKQLAEKLGLSFKSKVERPEPGVVTNSEHIKRIKKIESGKAELIEVSLKDLKKLTNA